MDDGALYGYSLFETLRAKRGTFWRPEAHHERLCAGAAFFGITPPTRDAFLDALETAHDSSRDEVLRYTLWVEGGRWSERKRAIRERVLVAAYTPLTPGPRSLGLATRSLAERDPVRDFKCGSRIAYQAEYERAREQGFHDALFYDHRERILETSTCNLFFLREGSWVTPPRSLGLLPGITRARVIERGDVREAEISLSDLESVGAVVAGNSVQGLFPIDAIGDFSFPTVTAQQWIEGLGAPDYRPISRGRQKN